MADTRVQLEVEDWVRRNWDGATLWHKVFARAPAASLRRRF
jgi:hypothetical protein